MVKVSDSITWRRFCRIPLDGAVPHPTTLMELTTRCGSTAVNGLNEALLAKAAEAKVLRTNRVHADTTVVPANVANPTDSGLLAKAIRRISTAGQRIHDAGGAVRTNYGTGPERPAARHTASPRNCGPAPNWARDQVKDSVQRITGELADRGIREAAAGRRRGRLARAVNNLSDLLEATERIVSQTRQRIAGTTPDGATRVVSLHDRQARPIAKGRLVACQREGTTALP